MTMDQISSDPSITEKVSERARQLFQERQLAIFERTDHLFAGLLIFEWLAGILTALLISPRAWQGALSNTHLHVWAAIFLGGAIVLLPVYLALSQPGKGSTRQIIAVGQMLMSALLIHLTGGRIETHFHVFGSLAFLAFYRDWRVLISASAVVAIDHLLRGIYWPQSVYGVLTVSPWRWLEHLGWVTFEDIFLIQACLQSIDEMWAASRRQARIEATSQIVEAAVIQRTAELTVSEERFRSLCASSPMGIYEADPEGLWIYANARWSESSGLTLDSSFGSGWLKAIHPDDREMVERQWRAATRHGQEFCLEFRVLTAEARQSWQLARAIAIHSSDGHLQGFVGTLTDITERKDAEQRIHTLNEDLEKRVVELAATNSVLESMTRKLEEARDAAVQASRVKSEFVANISHEIRTPLSGVLGMAELLMGTPLNAEQKQLVTLLHDSGQSLLAIINDLLDFSKMEANKMELDIIDFSPAALLEDCTELLSPCALEKRLSLTTFVDPRLPAALKGDQLRLRQVLLNLGSNAIKFTEVGQVCLRIDFDSENDSAVQVRFSVTDTGIGIPPSAQSRLFQPFVQADGSTTRKYGGTGLGLSICRSLIELMGSQIVVASEEGKGSTFAFTVTLKRSSKLDVAPAERAKPTARKQGLQPAGRVVAREAAKGDAVNSVLLVEDNPVLQILALRQLKRLGWPADAVSTGCEAVQAVGSKQYALVLMDCQMPEMDGLEATAAIRRQESATSRHLPIIAMTASAMDSDRQECLAAGMDDYLSKPVSEERLRDVMDRWVCRGFASESSLEAGAGRIAEDLEGKAGPVTSSSQPVDVSQLRQIYGESASREIVQMFLHEVRSLVTKIQASIDKEDQLELIAHLHQLKGLSATLAASHIHALSLDLERSCQAKNWQEAHVSQQALSEAVNEATAQIHSFLGGHAAASA